MNGGIGRQPGIGDTTAVPGRDLKWLEYQYAGEITFPTLRCLADRWPDRAAWGEDGITVYLAPAPGRV